MSEMVGSAVCIFIYHSPAPGSPCLLPGVPRAGIQLPRAVGLVGLPHPRATAPVPHPAPAPAPPPRRASPSPAPSVAAASAGLPRTLAEASPGSARSAQSCSGGRMPSVSVSCYGNPDRGEFRIRSETEPQALPDPPLASRPPGRPRTQAPARGRLEVLLLRPQYSAPEMLGMQIEQNLFSLCIA